MFRARRSACIKPGLQDTGGRLAGSLNEGKHPVPPPRRGKRGRRRVEAFQEEGRASLRIDSSEAMSTKTHTVYRAPQGWKQVLAVQVGMGCDLHGQSATKAAIRACRHAIEFTDLPCIHDVVPERYQGVKLKVQVACPSPGMVDVCELRRVFPFGTMEIDVGEGGMRTHSCSMVPELGEGSDDMFVAVAAVTVGY